jgi:hypothetical protein
LLHVRFCCGGTEVVEEDGPGRHVLAASACRASPDVVFRTEPRKVASCHCLPSRLVNGAHQQGGKLIPDQGVGLRRLRGTLRSDGQRSCAEVGCDVPTLGRQGLLPDVCAAGLPKSPESIMRVLARGRSVDALADVLLAAADETALFIANAPDQHGARDQGVKALNAVLDGLRAG